MSALPPKADMCGALTHVRFGPIADIPAGRIGYDCGFSPPFGAILNSTTSGKPKGGSTDSPHFSFDRHSWCARYVVADGAVTQSHNHSASGPHWIPKQTCAVHVSAEAVA